MSELPIAVLRERERLTRLCDQEKLTLLDRLIQTEDCRQMWRALERRSIPSHDYDDGLWVSAFLEAVQDASSLPPYQYASAQDRRDIAARLQSLSRELQQLLTAHDLDCHIVHLDGKLFHGLYVLDDFGESNQIRMSDVEKVKSTALIEGIAERATRVLEEVSPAKQGAQIRAVRFVRKMAHRNKLLYGEVLNGVLASAANEMFGTTYSESDVRNLLARAPSPSPL